MFSEERKGKQSESKLGKDSIQESSTNELRLLSINAVRKYLGIRHQTVKDLIRIGRIRIVKTANNKIRVPYRNLLNYLSGDFEFNISENDVISVEATQNRIDSLIEEYSD